jgi:hypothetical protein
MKCSERIKKATIGEWINFVCFVVSVVLAVVGFIIPPTGEIDNSVLICIGELGFFSTLTKIPDFIRALKNGASVEISKGDAHIKIEGEEQ